MLGVVLASIVSAVCDMTGDHSSDAQVKVKRVINRVGPSFLLLTNNWPFLRTDISFSITTASSIYSGSSYIPESFKRVVGAILVNSNNTWFPIYEVGIKERYGRWLNPDENSNRPKHFCITRPESGYYEIEFDHIPDATYTFKADIEQKWTNLTANTSQSIITDDYYGVFAHYCAMNRARDQGDFELYTMLKGEWSDPRDPKQGLLQRTLANLINPLRKKAVTPSLPKRSKLDYNSRGH